MSGTLSYATSVRLTDVPTHVSLPVETGDERVAAAGEVCAKIIWPLEHEVVGVESVLLKPDGLEVRISDELNRASVEAGVFRVLSWVLGPNITRAPVATESEPQGWGEAVDADVKDIRKGFYVGSDFWYQIGDTIYIEGPDGLTEELPADD
jgi:hypothetical protein